VLSAEEMRSADRRTIEQIGLPGAVLMENAGAAVAAAIQERFPAARRVLILCGKGNNGGDGYVVARRLLDRKPTVLLFAARSEIAGHAALHLGALEQSGGSVTEVRDAQAWAAHRHRLLEADLVVDALLGTGLSNAPQGLLADVIGELAVAHAERGVPVVAVDIPSGLPSDGGDVPWATAAATLTVTFAAPKWGHVVAPACNRVGELRVADIGIPRRVLEETGTQLWLLEDEDAACAFPPREPAAHKGAFGHVLIVAGGLGKTGAAVLAGTAALRAGAGLVTVATPEPALPIVAAGRPELMTEPLPVDADGGLSAAAIERVLALAQGKDAVALGPGLGQAESTRRFVFEVVRQAAFPLVVDADGLNCLAPGGARSGLSAALPRRAPTVLTPHPGEMARLVGLTTEDVQRRRVEVARRLAHDARACVALKGQRTVVASAEGRTAINPTGNAGMATGGTGDVLTGMIGALLARGLDPWLATSAAVYLHGRAGDLAVARVGLTSLAALDLIDALPDALATLTRRSSPEVGHR
jgi:NAD(P)H-hydrate epimerase